MQFVGRRFRTKSEHTLPVSQLIELAVFCPEWRVLGVSRCFYGRKTFCVDPSRSKPLILLVTVTEMSLLKPNHLVFVHTSQSAPVRPLRAFYILVA